MRPLAHRVAERVVPWRERDWPVDWAAAFGRAAPLALEIGFGNGAFLEREARARPERNHLGIEVSWTSVTYLLRRLERAPELPVRAVLGDAEAVLRHAVRRGALAEVFVNHPCPWPKDRHAERRLVRPAVLRLLADRMAPGAPLTIVTDHDGYAAWIAEALEGEPALASETGATRVDAIPGREATKYERKALARGERIHYFRWARVAAPDPPVPDAEPLPLAPMPSLLLQGDVPADRLFEGFRPLVRSEERGGAPCVVRLQTAWREERRDAGGAWLVEATVVEGRLQQDFGLQVARTDDGWLVKPSHLGRPHPTHGVKRAVWLAAAWLRERHDGLAVARHTLGAEAAAP